MAHSLETVEIGGLKSWNNLDHGTTGISENTEETIRYVRRYAVI